MSIKLRALGNEILYSKRGTRNKIQNVDACAETFYLKYGKIRLEKFDTENLGE